MFRLLCIAAIILAIACCASAAKQPHILMVVADDYGWNDIGYHSTDLTTPFLDKLAAEGVKLENYYVQPVCTPSRSCFMTGRYPIRTGRQHAVIWPDQPAGLFLNETTLPQKLKQYGYSTHGIGKWHLGFFKQDYVPIKRGFDTFYGYYMGAQDYFFHNRSISASPPAIPEMDGFDFRRQDQVDYSVMGTYSSHLYASEVERIVSQYKANNSENPMFFYVAMQTCHDPVQAPDYYIQKCSHIEDLGRRTFCAMVLTLDEAVANMTKALEDAGLWNDTIMIFTTDNGGWPDSDGNNYPLRGGKFTLWEGGVRGVSFVHGRGVKPVGTTNHKLYHAVDWWPTIVGLASNNGELQGNDTHLLDFPLDGHNIWASINGDDSYEHPEVLLNIDPLANTSAIRMGDWKLITGKQPYSGWIKPPTVSKFESFQLYMEEDIPVQQYGDPVVLFNVTHDPLEQDDLSTQYPDVVKQLLARIESYVPGMLPPDYPPFDAAANPKFHNGVWGPWQ